MNSLMRKPTVRVTLSTIFQAVQGSLGVSVTPSHFYFPVPDFKSFRGKDWTACRPTQAIDFRFAEQIERLRTELSPYISECNFPEGPSNDEQEFHFNNGFFERVDAEIAYAFVRQRKPRTIIEIGSGNTTRILTAALRRNRSEGVEGELIGIEPHPALFLKKGIDGLSHLLEQPVQKTPIELFRTLKENDILFIDSSHVVSVDSDVLFECLRILPVLAPGVLVHFHDIFTPLDYPQKFVMTNLCFWGEQYMLESFLSFNCAFRVLWSSSAMQEFHPDVLETAFPAWQGSFARMRPELKAYVPSLDQWNVWPCSFWIERAH
ncbi:MAG TPA: class I SAM-dependent methyltransferase [Terracidiphilus sp.]|nr:class I SAM-dependent methyltransferase [Terracidiphilus sp.]